MTKNKKKLSTIPVKINRGDFNRYIDSNLSKGSRGPRTKISRFKIFNYILYALHSGCPWYALPIYRNEISWSAIYKQHCRWCRDGSYENLLMASVINLDENNKLDLSILHGDGNNTVAKKGARK